MIGTGAKNQTNINPANTVFNAKRLIGRRFSDPVVQEDMKHWPFKVVCVDGDKPDYRDDMHNHWYDTIYSIKSKSGVTYYLPVERWKADGRTSGQRITAFTITDTGLVMDCKIFKTRKSLLSTIELHDPDMAEYYEIKAHEININNNGHTLCIPQINASDKFTSKWLSYEFDGEYFVYKGITK